MWTWTGSVRPPFAHRPRPGQESVWDYPRPPRIEATSRTVEVSVAGRRIAGSVSALRVLETAAPPTWYLPPADIEPAALASVPGHSSCEWKGMAEYLGLADAAAGAAVAWRYRDPRAPYAALRDYVAFYPGRVTCLVDGERVRPQAGGFYGGWITDDVAGPFKGGPGTDGW